MHATRKPCSAPVDPHALEEDGTELAPSEASPGFGSHFRQLRRVRGLTQEQLAERSGVAADTIRRLEYNSFSPSYRTLEKIAHGLRLPISRIIEGYELRERDLGGEIAGLIDALDEELREPFFTLVSQLHDLVSGAVSSVGDDEDVLSAEVPATIGKHIRSLRRARGMTQEELAARAGFAADTLRRAESGRATYKVIQGAASAMGLSLSVFFASYELREHRVSTGAVGWIEVLEPAARVHAVRALEKLRILVETR